MKRNSLLKIFLLFNGILSILAVCPGYPTLPTTSIPKSDPIVLTSTSEGMASVTSSVNQMSVSMVVSLDEECPSGSEWSLFTISVEEEKVARVYVECDTFNVKIDGDSLPNNQLIGEIWTGTDRTINIILMLDLNNGFADFEIKSLDKYENEINDFSSNPSYTFDSTTKIYLCSDVDGASSALACTISHLQLTPIYPDRTQNLGDFTPVTQAFYPLTNGELSSLISSADSAHFGDSASSPTTGTSPSFDSSKSFVKITSKTQFLTFPLASMVDSDKIFVPTMTIAMWVRVASITDTDANIFSIYSDDDGELYTVTVSKDSLELNGNDPAITLDTWQLIYLNLYATPGSSDIDINLFVGDSSVENARISSVDLSTLKLRVGDSTKSFIGDVSAVRILSPGVRFITLSETCSSDIEIGFDPNALSCSEGASFNPYDNKCYSSCPLDVVTPFTDAPLTLCLSEEPEEPEEPEKPEESITVEESGGLSGGAIAGIVVGSVAGVALIAAVGYFVKIKLAKTAARKGAAKAYEMKSPTTETIATTTNMVSP